MPYCDDFQALMQSIAKIFFYFFPKSLIFGKICSIIKVRRCILAHNVVILSKERESIWEINIMYARGRADRF